MRPRLRAAVEHFREVGGPATAIAGAIAADGLDLLVDLKGWTRGNRLEALALRPAPVQALWLGFPATTGAPWIDYHIVDAVVVPPGCEADFSEKLIRLPHCYQPVDSRRAMAAAGHRAEHGLPDSALVLACFCQSAKITAEVFASWLRLLAALPDAVLWLLQPEAAVADRLRALAAAAGLDPARLFFGPPLPQAAHLARYTLADLALETFPCGSHTTASDALWAGCPQVAITGDSFVSRVSTSVVRAAGLPELAVDSVAAAEALVLRLGRDRAALAALRARVANARAAPLFDAGRSTRDLEAAFRMMVREK
jgi:predicted O-linked N-acetylglucosamine transferase (SPINDLY family)